MGGDHSPTLLGLIEQGYAAVEYRSRPSVKPLRTARSHLKTKLKKQSEDVKMLTVKVHGHGLVAFGLVRDKKKATEMLQRIERYKGQYRSVEALVLDMLPPPRVQKRKEEQKTGLSD
jgi:acetylornithine/succinyldiaminopimelate/putrescine aminotransferase